MNTRNYEPTFDSMMDAVFNAIVKHAEGVGSGIHSVDRELAAAITSAVILRLESQARQRNHAEKYEIWEVLSAEFKEAFQSVSDDRLRNIILGTLIVHKDKISDAVLNVVNKNTTA